MVGRLPGPSGREGRQASRLRAGLLAAALFVSGCAASEGSRSGPSVTSSAGGSTADGSVAGATATPTSPADPVTTTVVGSEPATTGTVSPPTEPAGTVGTDATEPEADSGGEEPTTEFEAVISPIDDVLAERMSSSWRPGCPVPLEDLSHVSLTHWNLAGEAVPGEIVVRSDQAERVVEVFRTLFEARFPIERMQLVDDFEGDDVASMRADNTSGFNCREVANRPGHWSLHAFGLAIDVNPLLNPYVHGDVVEPPEGAPFVDRTRRLPGMIEADDVVVRAFAAIGWGWGGDFAGGPDYQHFSLGGG